MRPLVEDGLFAKGESVGYRTLRYLVRCALRIFDTRCPALFQNGRALLPLKG